MASRKAIAVGFAGLGVAVAGAVAFLLSGGEGAAPVPEDAPAPVAEAAPAVAKAPAAAPEAPRAAVAPAGDGSVRGRLVRGVARNPLAGDVRVQGEGFAPVKGAAGADGRFVLDGVPRARAIVLRADAPGVLPAEIPCRVPSTGVLELGDVVLGAAVPLEVKVRDAGDRPVAGASVALQRARPMPQTGADWVAFQFEGREPPPAAFTLTTDAEGRVTFDAAPPGSWT